MTGCYLYLEKCVLNTLPGSGIVVIGLSGNKIPRSINSSRLARTDILRSRAKFLNNIYDVNKNGKLKS